MRVLVTGHRGYIGSALTPLLQAAGHEVLGCDSGLFAACAFAEVPQVAALDIDVRDIGGAQLEDIDAVVHLAGLCNDPLGDLNPELTAEINYRASLRLARLAQQAGVCRFLFASSCSVYGAAGEDWLDEDSAKAPVTPYGWSKLNAELDISALADDGFCPVFLRAGTAYGVSPMIRFDLVLNNLAAWAAATGVIRLKSDGSAWRPVVHVEDIARAYAALLAAPAAEIANRAFNIGSTAENYRVRDLAAIVQRAFPHCRIETVEQAATDVRCYRVNCDRLARALPGFRLRWSAAEGAAQLRDALGRPAILPGDFEGARFQRLAHLKRLIADGALDGTLRRQSHAVAR